MLPKLLKYVAPLSVCAALLNFSGAEAAEPRTADRIPSLIVSLGSNRYAERQQAARALDNLGSSALESLRQAARSPDLEVRNRAEDLLRKIENRLLSARLAEPKRIRLVFEETPLTQAVAEFSRQTGYPMRYQRGANRAANATVTLDTGEVPFWEAFALFCQKAGVVERNLLSDPQRKRLTNFVNLESQDREILRVRLQREMFYGRDGLVNQTNDPFALVDGKMPALPTYHASAVRVQALTPDLEIIPRARSANRIPLVLEVTPEPKLDWKQAIDVRIENAVDENGKFLELLGGIGGLEGDYEFQVRTLAMLSSDIIKGDLIAQGLRQIPLQLQAKRGTPRLIKELKGSISALIHAPSETLVRVDDVLQAAGKSFNVGDGLSITVAEAKHERAHEFSFCVELPGSAVPMMIGRGVNRRMRFAANSVENLSPLSTVTFALQDAQGKPLQLRHVESSARVKTKEVVPVYALTFYAVRGQEGPFELVITGQRPAVIEVPFVLKDIPIP